MKKLFAFALAAIMLLTMSFAVAEGKSAVVCDEVLTLNVVYPEGYTVETEAHGDFTIVKMTKEGASTLNMVICPDEEYADCERLNDMEEADMEGYLNSLMEDYHDGEATWLKTEHGTDVVLLHENDAVCDFAELVTFYHGYAIDLMIEAADGQEVTEADVTIGMQFLSDMDFVATEK